MAKIRSLHALLSGVLTAVCSFSVLACGDGSGGTADGSGGDGTGGSASGSGGSASGTGGDASGTGGGSSTGGSSSSGGSTSGSGGATGPGGNSVYACGSVGEFCAEYRGSAEAIDAIRDATECEESGGTELDECPREGAVYCTIGESGMQSAQFYYGWEDDEVELYRGICDSAGGTFSEP